MTEETKREQTLLEAAKAMSRACEGTSRWDVEVNQFRAAIAREEAKPADYWQTHLREAEAERDACCADYQKEAARAQQAEADAAWHRSESARLSAELAKERERTVSTATNWRRQVDQVREEAEAAPDEPTIDAITSLRQRAEKAEGERDLAKNQLALAVERSERQSALIQSATQASGCHMPADVPDSIRGLRARAEKAEAELAERRREGLASEKAKPQQSHPMDGGEITVMLNRAGVKATTWPGANGASDLTTPQRVEWLIREWDRLRLRVDLAKEALGGKL